MWNLEGSWDSLLSSLFINVPIWPEQEEISERIRTIHVGSRGKLHTIQKYNIKDPDFVLSKLCMTSSKSAFPFLNYM
jgi:hypothetical protein